MLSRQFGYATCEFVRYKITNEPIRGIKTQATILFTGLKRPDPCVELLCR